MEKKILPPLRQGFELTTFQSWVQRSNYWAIPAHWFVTQMNTLIDSFLRENELDYQT